MTPRRGHHPRGAGSGAGLSQHILPSAATMIGVCTTFIGLVKIIEARIGPSHVDEYAALTAVLFLASAGSSYLSMRWPAESRLSILFEAAADACFVLGLVSLSVISVLFAYEAV
ncbi:hypothetical protein GGR33_000297 [Methylobacterium brachythecii]|nr:hypothetical protein [Methylobacterium brachythecii]MBB3900817.1 hypothetical protein [Methylobacterium brachythecii]